MAAAASGGATPGSAGSRTRRGRPRGSKSRRSPNLRWSKPPKKSSRPSPAPAPSSSGPPNPNAAAAGAVPALPFPPGTEVEVRVDDDGFHGSWFEATVLDFAPARGYRHPARYTVKYVHLLADDDEGVLAEPFAPSHIRPRPPPPPLPLSPPPHFRTHDIVEAFHNEGWWSGIVVSSSAPNSPGAAVTVAFPITREVIEFAPALVRPRRDYVDGGAWIPSRAVVAVRPKRAVKGYEVGEKVEVVRHRASFGESWFPATVRVVVDDLSYVVKYYDLEEGEGEGWAEKATEYLHWQFIRPAVDHSPKEIEFQFVPGDPVEAYCDGAWSPGVVRRVLEDSEYEIGIAVKKTELLVTKLVSLLKPQYKWNGKQWRVVAPKRRANSRLRSVSGKSSSSLGVSGKSPSSPVDVLSSDEEHCRGKNTSAEGSEHALVSEMDIPLSAPCKSPESTHSPDSSVSEKNIPQGSLGILNSVPMNGLLCGSPGHSTPVDNQEILSDMVVSDGELNGPASGRSVDDHDMLSIAELRKKMASKRRNSAVQRTQENTVKSLRVKKCTLNTKAGKTHPVQELQGKIQLSGNINFSTRDIVLALGVSGNGRTILSPDRLVSIGRKRGSSTKVLACKKLANRRGSKAPCSPNSSLDVARTVQQRGSREITEPMEECPLALEFPKSGTQEQLDRTLEDAQNITELSNQDPFPMVPPGFEAMDNGKGTNIHDTQFDEQPTGTTNSCIEPKGNGDMCIEHGRSQCIMNSTPLRMCSTFESLLPSPCPLSQVSNHQDVFVKNSPMWHLVEAMDVFKEFPQQPHFLPLLKEAAFLREGMALGLMVSFADLVKITMEATIDNSMEWFEDKIMTISHLEANGFTVQFMQSAMNELVEIKSERTRYHGEIGKLDSEFEEKTVSSSRVGALLDAKDVAAAELEQELGRIRQESQRIAKEKEKIDAEVASIKAALSGYEDLRKSAESKFKEVLARLRLKRLT